MAEISAKRAAIAAKGTQLAFVHMGQEEPARKFFANYGMEDAERVSDPARKLYKVFKLVRGGIHQIFGWRIFKREFRVAFINGHGLGMLAGDVFQMPGVFLIHQSMILRAFVHQTIADKPDYMELTQ